MRSFQVFDFRHILSVLREASPNRWGCSEINASFSIGFGNELPHGRSSNLNSLRTNHHDSLMIPAGSGLRPGLGRRGLLPACQCQPASLCGPGPGQADSEWATSSSLSSGPESGPGPGFRSQPMSSPGPGTESVRVQCSQEHHDHPSPTRMALRLLRPRPREGSGPGRTMGNVPFFPRSAQSEGVQFHNYSMIIPYFK